MSKILKELKRPFVKPLSLVPKWMKIAILQYVVESPSSKFCEKLYASQWDKKNRGLKYFDSIRNDFWGDSKKRDLLLIQEKVAELARGMDDLSLETIDRFWSLISFGNGIQLGMNYAHFRQFYSELWPLYFAECNRLEQLEKQWKNPYVIEGSTYSLDGHMATGFGMEYFSPKVQQQVKGKDIIDGGGCCGDSAMILSEYDSRHVYSFEPNPESIPEMERVLDDNAAALGERRQKISVVPYAIGKERGKINIHTGGAFDGGTTVRNVGYGHKTYQCDTISLDEYVRENHLNVGLIKLDIEGAEYDAIEGALDTIRTQKPLLIISIYHTVKDFLEIKPMLERLGVGYKFFIRHLCIHSFHGEYCLFAYVDEP